MLLAGEASGDLHASELIRALRASDPNARFCFFGGDMMAESAGCAPTVHYKSMAYMGFAEVVRHLPQVRRNLATAVELLRSQRPDALILVDYPSFNLRVGRVAHRMGIPVYYYISPKVWAWKAHRVKAIKQICRRVLSILPFEEEFYAARGYRVDYVGNPSVEEMARRLQAVAPFDEFCRQHHLPARPIIGLFPGSRLSEIRTNLPIMLEAARSLEPRYQIVVSQAPGVDREVYRPLTQAPVVADCATPLMRHSTVALVTSGTATLECALVGTPQVVCFRHNGSRLFYSLMKRWLTIPYVSLPNLIAGAEVVPELLVHQCTPERVRAELENLLPETPGRRRQLDGYAQLRRRLGTDSAACRAAQLILADLTGRLDGSDSRCPEGCPQK
jgi:lipid-A-disaccharide synthase